MMRNAVTLGSLSIVLALVACKKEEENPAPAKQNAAEKSEVQTKTEPAAEPKTAAEEKPAVEPKPTAEPKPTTEERPEGVVAEAKITSASGSKVEGIVYFSNEGDKVKIHSKIQGLTPGQHGFHVHETGDCSAPDAKSAGGHFNPAGMDHGAAMDGARHIGDLGNVLADEQGISDRSLELPNEYISIKDGDKHNVIGRAVVVHGGADDLDSQPSGNAGPRVGCGVIEAVTSAAAE